jgi:hypothetical protein
MTPEAILLVVAGTMLALAALVADAHQARRTDHRGWVIPTSRTPHDASVARPWAEGSVPASLDARSGRGSSG